MCTTNNKEELEEKIIQKLQNALNSREEQLEKIKEKIREHVSLGSLFLVGVNNRRNKNSIILNTKGKACK
jgi:hypothetical protein